MSVMRVVKLELWCILKIVYGVVYRVGEDVALTLVHDSVAPNRGVSTNG